MASEPRSSPVVRLGWPSACLAVLLTACAAQERRFPLREPLWQDTDLRPVLVPCRAEPTKDDPKHVSCAPRFVESPTLWDGADSMVFWPLSDSLAVVAGTEAVNANSLDEVPDSSWFVNRLGRHPMTAEAFAFGACTPALLLGDAPQGDGTWVIDKGKMDGSTDGFRVKIPGKGKYLFKADDEDTPEHSSASQTIGSKVLYAVGYPTTCEQIVYFRPAVLKLTPGLHWKHNFDDVHDFDRAALDKILARSPKRGELVRMQASAWLPGEAVGGFRYEGTRADDPNDVIPHENRRELRGKRILDAWLGRVDERRGNTLDTWFADGPRTERGAPGHVVHHHMDMSEILGSEWGWDEVSRRLGHAYVLDWGDSATDLVTLGVRTRPWDTAHRVPGKELFGYYEVDDFDPERWKSEYPVVAFSRMTERDGAWMARILARFTPEMVRALAGFGDFKDPENTTYLAGVLEGRLGKVLERYLTRLSPIADVRVEGPSGLCGVDLAELRRLRRPEAFRYAARLLGGGWLPVERRPGGEVCVSLPHVAKDGGAADDASERYVRVRLEDGIAKGPLVAHLYDLGPARGYRLAGLERPE